MEEMIEFQKTWTPKSLAGSTIVKKWVIPIYQRLFVWQEEQIQQLLMGSNG